MDEQPKHTKSLKVRLTPEQDAKLRAVSALAFTRTGCTLSDWVRDHLNAAADKEIKRHAR